MQHHIPAGHHGQCAGDPDAGAELANEDRHQSVLAEFGLLRSAALRFLHALHARRLAAQRLHLRPSFLQDGSLSAG